ncbi:type II toxin-antitoxin system YafQ family toxin [Vibrio sp.]|uniref:type II toxin-antitoxin system YafQ family toxin n=1 Tax=Vibrio sp. TaxID=678 RepID=UPI003AA7FD2E
MLNQCHSFSVIERSQKHSNVVTKFTQPLHPHILQGNWKPHRECHLQPDLLLIWDIDLESNELILVRCGSHAELFG